MSALQKFEEPVAFANQRRTQVAAPRGWTRERLERLKTLWLAGQSAVQIAHELGGVSRSAVLGKVYRLGLGREPAPKAPKIAVAAKPRAPRLTHVKPVILAEPKLARAPRSLAVGENGSVYKMATSAPLPKMRLVQPQDPLPLERLGRDRCHHPVNDGEDPQHGWLYCAAPVDQGEQYCPACKPILFDARRTRESNRQMARAGKRAR